MANVEQKIWNYFKSKGLNDYGTAGLMGNLFAESCLISTNLQNSFEDALKYTDASYTAAVDNGSYTNFVHDKAGYGLAQWTFWSRKQELLNYAKSVGKSIGDLDMQLDFLWRELTTSFKEVVAVLRSATSIRQASNAVLLDFEAPKRKDEIKTQNDRAGFSQIYYDKFAQKSIVEDIDLKTFTQLFNKFRNGLQDNNASEYSGPARRWAIAAGLFVGSGITAKGELNYMWRDFVTREQLITVLYRFFMEDSK